jgi:XTP/dITP diphosphohydrolase
LPALADDSGLCVDALAGAPGIYSARWAGEARDFASAMKRVEREVLAANPEAPPKAHFACVLALAFPDGEVETFEGKVFGALQFPPRGSLGFGYDPIFLAQGLFADIWRDDRRRKARRSGRWLGGPFAPGARIPSLCAAPRRLSEI